MRRPLANIPRLRQLSRPAAAPKPILLACPRVSPDWELAAVQALIKPQVRGAILHRDAQQVMPREWKKVVESISASLAAVSGFQPVLHWPAEGDYWFAAQIEATELVLARALAVSISQHLPGVWIIVGKIFVRDGQFFRRQYGVKLNLVPAANIHLPRGVRAALPKVAKLQVN